LHCGTASGTAVTGGFEGVAGTVSATMVKSGVVEIVYSGGLSDATPNSGAQLLEVELLASDDGAVLSLAPITSTMSNFDVPTDGAFSHVVSALSSRVMSGGEIPVSSV
jgi:hypothetical protein